MLYYVTDNTMLRLERAYLLANCQLTKAETSMYNGNKQDINNKELTISWTCFPITGFEVDKAAKSLLEDITGVSVTIDNSVPQYKVVSTENVAALDSSDYKYGIMDSRSPSKIDSLVNAIK